MCGYVLKNLSVNRINGFFTDLRSSRCYLAVEEWSGRNRCLKEMGEPVTRATCCCSVGKAWGSRCELCPPPGSEEYKQLCPGGTGYRPNSVTVCFFDNLVFI